jgi:hypothetical protein
MAGPQSFTVKHLETHCTSTDDPFEKCNTIDPKPTRTPTKAEVARPSESTCRFVKSFCERDVIRDTFLSLTWRRCGRKRYVRLAPGTRLTRGWIDRLARLVGLHPVTSFQPGHG